MNFQEKINSEGFFFFCIMFYGFDRESCWMLVEMEGFEVL